MPESEPMKVLHVDDDPDIREIARLALDTVGGMNVSATSSAKEALEVLQSFKPDVILLDFMMPGISGEELYQSLQENAATRDIPCIFMTARVQAAEVQSMKDLGATGVIEKPFDPMTLADQIRKLLSAD